MKHRRLVNIHVTGRYAGIAHIHGVETADPLPDDAMPLSVEVALLDGRVRLTELVHMNERAAFYREVQT